MKFLKLLLLAPLLLQDPPAARVVVVPIVDEIGFRNLALVRRAVREIKASKPALVIFEIDTPGGRLDHTLSMGEAMMSLAPIPTVAYVRPLAQGGNEGGAWSAGAYLALSCKKLFMYPGTVIGAAAPVAASSEGMRPLEEKYVSAFREKFRARADQSDYPGNLAVAMVDKDLEIFEVVIDGVRRYLTEREMDLAKADGKVFDWPRIPFDSKDKLLTLSDRQVVHTGLGRLAESRVTIYKDAGLSSPAEQTIEASWSEDLAGFLTSGAISSALLVIGILGIWIELKTPGIGIAGVVGVLAIALMLFGQHLVGLAEIPEILLFILGIALISIELLVFPGTGFFAISGAACTLAALVLSFQDFTIPDPKGAPWQMDVLLNSLGRVLVSFVGAALSLAVLLKYLPKLPLFGRLVLQTELAGSAPAPAGASALAGRRGRAVSPLRPSGKVEIDGELHDVVSEGDFVEAGEAVEVLRVEGLRVVVGRVKA